MGRSVRAQRAEDRAADEAEALRRWADVRATITAAAAVPRAADVPEVGGESGGVPGVRPCCYHDSLNVNQLCREGCPLALRLNLKEG